MDDSIESSETEVHNTTLSDTDSNKKQPPSNFNDPKLRNAALYNSYQFTFLRRHENNGRNYGLKCWFCSRIFINLKESTMSSHRNICKDSSAKESTSFDNQPESNAKNSGNFNDPRLRNAELYNLYQFTFLRRHEHDGRNYGLKCWICSRVFTNLKESTMISHRKVCKVASDNSPEPSEYSNDPRLRNAELYNSLQFTFLRKHENNGRNYGLRCWICKRVFINLKPSTLVSHRSICKGSEIMSNDVGTSKNPESTAAVFLDDMQDVEMENEDDYHQPYENDCLEEDIINDDQNFDKLSKNETTNNQISEMSCANQDIISENIESDKVFNESGNRQHEKGSSKGSRLCYICNRTSDFYYQNLFKTKSKHSNTRICDFVKRWLGFNESKRMNAINATDNDQTDDHCVCIDCFIRINEYDLMYTTAERIDKELRDIFLHTEQTASFVPKIEIIDEHSQICENTSDAISDEIGANNGETIESSQTYDDEDNDDFRDTLSDDENERSGKVPKSNKNLRSHVKSFNNKDVKAQCDHCGELILPAKMFGHILRFHTETTEHFKCNQCDKVFRLPSELQKHLRVHSTNYKPDHLCSTCGKQFTTSGNLNQHMRIHGKTPKLNCKMVVDIEKHGSTSKPS